MEGAGGGTRGAHLRQAQKSAQAYGLTLDEVDDYLMPPIPPPGFEFLWEVFVDLSSSRQIGFSPCPIAYSDILAWCQLNRVQLRVWEVDLLRRVDDKWMQMVHRQMKDKREQETPEPENPQSQYPRRVG